MVFAADAFEYPHIFRVADLAEQFPTSELHIALAYMITILGCPNQLCCASAGSVVAVSVLFHRAALLTFLEVGSN